MRRRGPKAIEEREAEGEVERVYHEVRQVMRVSGVSLNFRTWAGMDGVLPPLWDALRATAATAAFEESADRLRAMAAGAAAALPRPEPAAAVPGESRNFQIDQALRLYHYVNPKLLLFTAAARRLLEGEAPAGGSADYLPQCVAGIPDDMYPMEMVEEDLDDPRVGAVFDDIRAAFERPGVNSVYRTLALWPDYLESAWHGLKAVASSPRHGAAVNELRHEARRLARELPYASSSPRSLAELARDKPGALQAAVGFEELLPRLIVDIAWLATSRWPAGDAARSPFPCHAEAGSP